MLSDLFSSRLVFEHLKSELLRDVSVSRIGNTLSYGFPQTVKSLQAFSFGSTYKHLKDLLTKDLVFSN